MKRLTAYGLILTAAFLAGSAFAGTYEEEVVSQLDAQGYQDIRQSRTLLGRSRIVAVNQTHRREIVLDPNTGEILRDLWSTLVETPDAGGDGELRGPSPALPDQPVASAGRPAPASGGPVVAAGGDTSVASVPNGFPGTADVVQAGPGGGAVMTGSATGIAPDGGSGPAIPGVPILNPGSVRD